MSGIVLTLLAVAIAITALRLSRPAKPTAEARPQARLRMTLNPRVHATISPVWQLVRDPNCTRTTKLETGLVGAERAANLEQLGCAPGRCQCHYAPMPDRRRRVRRLAEDRRDEIRFAADPDRRELDRRYTEQLWATPGYQR